MKNIETDVLIIGAGPVGLFCVFELGQLGIKSYVMDSLDEIGGQCSALYPEKPIYYIPGYPEITAENLIKEISKQIKPFNPTVDLNQRVEKLNKINNSFRVETTSKKLITAKCIIIAAGSGAFGPNKPPIPNIRQFEGKSLFYSIKDKSVFKERRVLIAGGGDSAVDWAIELSEIAEKIYFVHRRQKLRAAPHNVKKLQDLSTNGKIEMIIPYQVSAINGINGLINEIVVKDLNNQKLNIQTDFFLPFFGLSSDLGPIKNWELEIQNNNLSIDQSTCQTSQNGIFAVGDVCAYPGKLKLILTGFSEAAIAAHSCYNIIFPDKTLHFEYSTTKGVNKL